VDSEQVRRLGAEALRGRSRLARTPLSKLSSGFGTAISPPGVQAVHPDGEVAVARAAAARGTAVGLSSFASMPVEEVTAANPKTFFQMYWMGSKDDIWPGWSGPGPRERLG
jgi:hypothetical protein